MGYSGITGYTIRMIHTYTGENAAARGAALKEATQRFVAEHGDLALERLDTDDTDFNGLQEALQNLPFLAARKLVVLRQPGQNKQFIERFEGLIKGLPETTDVFIMEPKPDKRSTYYKQLKKLTDFKEFNNLDERGLARWLSDQAKAGQGSLNQSDALFLVERVGADQQQLSSELEKLMLYNPAVTRQTIELLTEPTPQSTIFELIETAFSGNTAKALKLYDEQRALKVEAPQIVAMLTWQLHILALLVLAGNKPADEVAKTAKLSPYVVRKNQSVASQLNRTKIRTLIHELVEIDSRTKQAPVDLDEALKRFLLQLK